MKWVLASDQSSFRSWLVQPIKELSSAAGLCAARGCALIRQLANAVFISVFWQILAAETCMFHSCNALRTAKWQEQLQDWQRLLEPNYFWLHTTNTTEVFVLCCTAKQIQVLSTYFRCTKMGNTNFVNIVKLPMAKNGHTIRKVQYSKLI